VGSTILAENRKQDGSDANSDINWRRYPDRTLIREKHFSGTLADYDYVLVGDSLIVVYTAFARDTAWLVRLELPSEKSDSIFVETGTDSNPKGDGIWQGLFPHLLTSDYDFDGHPEMFFNLNTIREGGQRLFLCVDPITFTLKWKIAIASPISEIIDCRDSVDPGVIVTTQAPGQGTCDSLLDDSNGYTIRVDSRGQKVFVRVTSTYPWGNGLRAGCRTGTFYVFYETDSTTSPPDSVGTRVDCYDYHGRLLHRWLSPSVLGAGWTADYDGDGRDEVYVSTSDGWVTVMSDSLVPIARGDMKMLPKYVGRIERFDGVHNVMVLGEANGSTYLYDQQFRLQAVIPNCVNFDVLSRGPKGEVVELLANSNDGDSYRVAFSRRDFWNYLAIFYRHNQMYVLSAMFALLGGLFVSNFYRSQARRNVATITRQREDLEKAHEALKDAQQQIIAQEKFRQAKDIAGGFAHEIRNALFPADSSITKLHMQAMSGNIDADLVTRHLGKVSAAITRAVDITELISSYTKLDTIQSPEKTDLGSVVREVVEANRARIEQSGVKVECDGKPAMSAWSNHQQLYIVINNLVLNSLDALENRPEGSIRMVWELQGEMVRLLVTDNGCGMDKEMSARIFDAFYSTKPYRGTGLGLTISKKIVELYGGTMQVRSEPGAGTTFEILLKSCSS
jgi:signal transduction histidine kinase